MLLTRHHGE